MREKILEFLKSEKDFVSGEKLSKTFGVSRTAIWKNISKLKEEGYEIQSVTKRGYKLLDSPDTYEKFEIMKDLNKKMWDKIIILDQVDSTNLEAKRLLLTEKPKGQIILADEQTQGKGRRGRTWASQKGQGIWCSVALNPDISPNKVSMITLVAGLSVCMAMRNKGIEAFIKWPNDIIVNNKKVCGILTEVSTEIDEVHHVILGMGVNINTPYFEGELTDKATSLKIEHHKNFKRSQILNEILRVFEVNYEQFLKDGDLSTLKKDYEKYCINLNREVRIIEKEKTTLGVCKGITSLGELIFNKENGETKIVNAGEVSVRGIDGYV